MIQRKQSAIFLTFIKLQFVIIIKLRYGLLTLSGRLKQVLLRMSCYIFIIIFSSGFLADDYLRECLMTMGDRWPEELVDDLFHGAPIKEGLFDYTEFTRMLKHGARGKDDDIPDIKPVPPPKEEEEASEGEPLKIPPEVPPKPIVV